VVCSLVGAAALTVALVVPLPWRGSAGLGSAAYAVSSEQDGSTRVAVRWSDLVDPARLQADLDRAGAPVRILTGTVYPIGEQRAVPACAQPTHGGPYDSRAVEWDLPTGSDLNGFVIRPKYFPPGGTLVIEVFFRAGQRKLDGSMSYMVVGSPPTCAQPVYSVASDGAGAR
jgi:hypothetical protein